MRKIINSTKKTVTDVVSFINQKRVSFITTIMAIPFLPLSANAASAESLVSDMVDVIFDIFRWIGILLLAWAIGQVVLAFKNEDADSKSRGMMMAVCAIALITLEFSLGGIVTDLL